MTDKHDRLLLLHLFQSFVTTWALMKASRMEPGNILTFVFFLLVFFFYRHVNRRMDLLQVSNRVALLTAVVFTALYMLVDYPHYIELLTSPTLKHFCNGISMACDLFIGKTGCPRMFKYLPQRLSVIDIK